MSYKKITGFIFFFLSTALYAQEALDKAFFEREFAYTGEYYFKNNTEKVLYLVVLSKIDKQLADKLGVPENYTAKKKLLPSEDALVTSQVLFDGLSFWPEIIPIVACYQKNIGIEQGKQGNRVYLDVSDPWKGKLIPGSYSIKLVDGEITIENELPVSLKDI